MDWREGRKDLSWIFDGWDGGEGELIEMN